jgi:hypothetical protein
VDALNVGFCGWGAVDGGHDLLHSIQTALNALNLTFTPELDAQHYIKIERGN